MPAFTVVVASGKGGTGKTLVSTALARRLAARGLRVAYADADVEAPNGQLVVGATIERTRLITRCVAEVELDSCSACGDCVQVCAFGALCLAPEGAVAFPEHCRDCRACELACRRGAIIRRGKPVGELASGRAGDVRFLMGTLRLGEQRGVPLVEALRSEVAESDVDVAVVDSPPGTACSAVATLRGADFALLVTEPTPFGEHDLRLACGLCRTLGVPAAGVLNRAGLGSSDLARVVTAAGLEQWAEIPYDPTIAEAIATGEDPTLASAALAAAIAVLGDRIQARLPQTRALAAGAEP
ncbi:MAG TPA: P-loop NTPase [Polyangiaceae bacterium]|nr:P-loop NTPase [Polyangiaceae bacterium]